MGELPMSAFDPKRTLANPFRKTRTASACMLGSRAGGNIERGEGPFQEINFHD
jgi:hypothetical protein